MEKSITVKKATFNAFARNVDNVLQSFNGFMHSMPQHTLEGAFLTVAERHNNQHLSIQSRQLEEIVHAFRSLRADVKKVDSQRESFPNNKAHHNFSLNITAKDPIFINPIFNRDNAAEKRINSFAIKTETFLGDLIKMRRTGHSTGTIEFELWNVGVGSLTVFIFTCGWHAKSGDVTQAQLLREEEPGPH